MLDVENLTHVLDSRMLPSLCYKLILFYPFCEIPLDIIHTWHCPQSLVPRYRRTEGTVPESYYLRRMIHSVPVCDWQNGLQQGGSKASPEQIVNIL